MIIWTRNPGRNPLILGSTSSLWAGNGPVSYIQPQYDLQDSSETLHRKCYVFRLVHRRRLHLLQFAFRLKDNIDLVDNKDTPTRCHEGVVFKIPQNNHYKLLRNPYYSCMIEWIGCLLIFSNST